MMYTFVGDQSYQCNTVIEGIDEVTAENSQFARLRRCMHALSPSRHSYEHATLSCMLWCCHSASFCVHNQCVTSMMHISFVRLFKGFMAPGLALVHYVLPNIVSAVRRMSDLKHSRASVGAVPTSSNVTRMTMMTRPSAPDREYSALSASAPIMSHNPRPAQSKQHYAHKACLRPCSASWKLQNVCACSLMLLRIK